MTDVGWVALFSSIDSRRFTTAKELKKHQRRCHKPEGFLLEHAKAERDKGAVEPAWSAAISELPEVFDPLEEIREVRCPAQPT